jgi:putative Mg2+ transporter-C (MgtC) family protein
MTTLTTLEFLTRLALGLSCGAAIGIERQWRARGAGLRTNMLVAAGATLFVLYSAATPGPNNTQIAAYVVSGIGFLGGGVILRDGFNVRGLNTAATLWCSAATGVLAAGGHLAFAAIATAAVLAIHLLGRPAGRLLDRDNLDEEAEDLRPYRVYVTCRAKTEPHIRALLVQHAGNGSDVILRGIDATRDPEASTVKITAHVLVDGDAPTRLEQLVARLSLEPGIIAVHWHHLDNDPTAPVPEPYPQPTTD